MKTNKSFSRLAMLFHVLAASMFANNQNEVKSARREIHGIMGGNGEFHPKKTKLKGWQKENKRLSFNKNR